MSTMLAERNQRHHEHLFSFSDRLELFTSALSNSLPVIISLVWGMESDVLELRRIVVPSAHRGKGVGTQALTSLCNFADAERMRLEVIPAGDDESSSEYEKIAFQTFYARFGFMNTGEGTMVREPSRRK